MKALVAVPLSLAACLVAAELVCRLLPVSGSTLQDYYTDPDVLTYPAHHRWQVATGWDLRNAQILRANNSGFVSAREFVPDPNAIALIGDSYVEASMLGADDRPGPQLDRALGGQRPVYALGRPGTALLDYAERIRLASQRWGVHDFVVLMEAGDIRQSLCGSGNVESRCLDRVSLAPRIERFAAPSVLKTALRDSALMQYLVGQLKIEPGTLWRSVTRISRALLSSDAQAEEPQARPGPDRPEVTRAVAAAFFQRIEPFAIRRLVIVVDGQRTRGELVRTPMTVERDRFIELARAAGATVIDGVPLYRQHFQQSPLDLSVGPYDGHFNRIGVRIVTAAAAQALQAKP